MELPHNFSPAREFPFRPSVYYKVKKVFGFEVESFVSGNKILGWYDYDKQWVLMQQN